MKNKNLITIIVPVFNTPIKFMERLFNSLYNQTNKNFNLLIIDDGSKLECALYLNSLVNKFNNFQIIHKINTGVSDTRNIGLSKVTTPYVAFADADDLYSIFFIEEALTYIIKYEPDIIFGVIKYEPDKKIIQSDFDVNYFDSSQALKDVNMALLDIKPRNLKYRILGTPCARIYKTSIAHFIGFRKDIAYYEDQIFNRECLKQAQKVLVVPNVWYTYFQNEFSAMHKERKNNFYKKTISYWDAFYELNINEPEEFKLSLRLKQLDFLYAVINNDYVSNKSIKMKQAVYELSNIILHPMIQDSLYNINIFRDKISLLSKINIILLKRKKYIVLLLEKRFIKLMNLNTDL